MFLSEIPLNEICLGDLCISALGNLGYVTKISYDFEERGNRLGWIEILWSNGNRSASYYDDGDGTWHWEYVIYIGKQI